MTPAPFERDEIAGRVVFGVDSRTRLPDEADRAGARRVLVVAALAEDQIAAEICDLLGDRVVGRFSEVLQHVPVQNAVAARAMATDLQADSVVTIGGGSATGFGKAVTLELDVVHIAVPTTYAGSEMTPIWGLTSGDEKSTGRDVRVKPDVVVYDPALTIGLPPSIAGPSGMNALAHCVEALYGPGADPITSLVALEGARVLAAGLPSVCARPDDLGARTEMLYGAYLAGAVLATGGTALHHKTCHVLGGMFALDHGGMNAVVVGHAVAYNAVAIPEIIARLEATLGVADAAAAMFDLAATIGAPTDLASIGMPADGIDEAARRIVIEASANVRPPDESSIRAMLDDAYHGRRPQIREAETT
jgi:alcohol dehydrogenase class IV